jgi:exosortase A
MSASYVGAPLAGGRPQQQSALLTRAPVPARRPTPNAAALLVTLIAIFALYWPTLWAMIGIWARSPTFAHGFLVLPASAWLAWRQRQRLAGTTPRCDRTGLLPLAALVLLWVLADAVNVPTMMQYALILTIPATLVALCGWQPARVMGFPLAYLLLAVPFGEIFIPPLIDFTAGFTVWALQQSGVPVFRENNYFSIPSGDWSVVDACSGLRYVIASLALGTAYAYLSYRSTIRRLAFILAALLLPLLANGVRAYLIVMLGHWSGMRLAAGVDHLIYGWLFFGLVCLLLFRLGACWREPSVRSMGPPEPIQASNRDVGEPPRTAQAGRSPGDPLARVAGTALACIAVAACGPALSMWLHQTASPVSDAPLVLPASKGWRATAAAPQDWSARHAGHPQLQRISYTADVSPAAAPVTLELAWYATQPAGADMLTAPPPAADPWRLLSSQHKTIILPTFSLTLRQEIYRRDASKVLVWRWYRQGGVNTAYDWQVKLLLAKNQVMRESLAGAELIASAPFDDQPASAERDLRRFLTGVLPDLTAVLDHAGTR